MDITALALAKNYANKVAAGFSSVTVEGSKIIFTLNDGKKATMNIPAPKDGVSVVDLEIDDDGSLLCHMSDNTTIDAGLVPAVKGDPGFSPKAEVSQDGAVTTISITDEEKTTNATIDMSDYVTVGASGGYSYTYDGVMEGKVTGGGQFFKISDDILTPEELMGATMISSDEGEIITSTITYVSDNQGIYAGNPDNSEWNQVYSVYETSRTFPEKGIYVSDLRGDYLKMNYYVISIEKAMPQEITGAKNFTGDLTKNGVEVATVKDLDKVYNVLEWEWLDEDHNNAIATDYFHKYYEESEDDSYTTPLVINLVNTMGNRSGLYYFTGADYSYIALNFRSYVGAELDENGNLVRHYADLKIQGAEGDKAIAFIIDEYEVISTKDSFCFPYELDGDQVTTVNWDSADVQELTRRALAGEPFSVQLKLADSQIYNGYMHHVFGGNTLSLVFHDGVNHMNVVEENGVNSAEVTFICYSISYNDNGEVLACSYFNADKYYMLADPTQIVSKDYVDDAIAAKADMPEALELININRDDITLNLEYYEQTNVYEYYGELEGVTIKSGIEYHLTVGSEAVTQVAQTYTDGIEKISYLASNPDFMYWYIMEGNTETTSYTPTDSDWLIFEGTIHGGYYPFVFVSRKERDSIMLMIDATYYQEKEEFQLQNNIISAPKTSGVRQVTAGEAAEAAAAFGQYTYATGTGSFTSGNFTQATGIYSHAEGYGTLASTEAAHAEGYWTQATGHQSHAEGSGTVASGAYSHAEGMETTASGEVSHTEGINTTATAAYSHAEGENSNATKQGAHAEGYESEAAGKYAHAEGYVGNAVGYASHSEGYRTRAYGQGAHAEGTETTAQGSYSHSEGNYTSASVEAAHSEGIHSKADGIAAHAEGYYTIAKGNYTHVEGKYNIEDTSVTAENPNGKYLHISGNGASGARANAYTLDWDGNGWFKGDVYVGSTSGKNKDEGSVRLAKVTEIPSAPEYVEFLPNLYYHYNGNMIEASTGCTFTSQKGIATLTKCKKADGSYITKVDCSISIEGTLNELIGNKFLIDTWFSIGELPYYNTSTGTKIYDVKLTGLTKTASPLLQLFDGGDYSKYLYFCHLDGNDFANYYADELKTGEFKLSCDITYYTTDVEA